MTNPYDIYIERWYNIQSLSDFKRIYTKVHPDWLLFDRKEMRLRGDTMNNFQIAWYDYKGGILVLSRRNPVGHGHTTYWRLDPKCGLVMSYDPNRLSH